MTTPTYNRQGITVDPVTISAGFPGAVIDRSCGVTIITMIPAADNIGPNLSLPPDADVGDSVEVYNVYTGGNPSQNVVAIYPASGETINFDTNPVPIAAKAMLGFRKIGPTSWFAK